MWRDDDFGDKGKNTKIVPRDWAGELIDHPDFDPDSKAEPVDRSTQEWNGDDPNEPRWRCDTPGWKEGKMSTMTLLIVLVVLILLFGGGRYGYRRWRTGKQFVATAQAA